MVGTCIGGWAGDRVPSQKFLGRRDQKVLAGIFHSHGKDDWAQGNSQLGALQKSVP